MVKAQGEWGAWGTAKARVEWAALGMETALQGWGCMWEVRSSGGGGGVRAPTCRCAALLAAAAPCQMSATAAQGSRCLCWRQCLASPAPPSRGPPRCCCGRQEARALSSLLVLPVQECYTNGQTNSSLQHCGAHPVQCTIFQQALITEGEAHGGNGTTEADAGGVHVANGISSPLAIPAPGCKHLRLQSSPAALAWALSIFLSRCWLVCRPVSEQALLNYLAAER